MGRGNLNLCVHIPTHVTLLFEGGGGIISLGDLWGGGWGIQASEDGQLKTNFSDSSLFFLIISITYEKYLHLKNTVYSLDDNWIFG